MNVIDFLLTYLDSDAIFLTVLFDKRPTYILFLLLLVLLLLHLHNKL